MTSATPPKVGAPRATQPAAASPMHRMVRIYGWAVIAGFALIPLGLVLYVAHWQPDTLLVRHHLHEIAIIATVVVGGFISYVTWRCYHYSGEVFLRWVTLGLAGFTLFYFVHGALTVVAKSHVQMFLNFGITARLVLLFCLMVAALRYRAPPDPSQRREAPGFWLVGLGALAVVAVAVASFSESALAERTWPRISAEAFTIACALVALVVQLFRDDSSPLMNFYVIALALLAQSSVGFLMSAPWNHTWWLAHLIGVAGFLMLSYGIAIAFRTTGSFAMVYSQEALINELREANAELEARASTDCLTGARTRGAFMRRAEEEIERARRHDHPLSLLTMDVDRFKDINDLHGHQTGDRVLQQFVQVVSDRLRPADVIGRVGGEEFLVLLPETALADARTAAERMRAAVAKSRVTVNGSTIGITVSIGVAEFGPDAETLDSWLSTADKRLYLAKRWGRNQVVSAPARS